MGRFDSISSLFREIGDGMYSIIQNPYALYTVYLFSFFLGVYALFSFVLMRTKLFRDGGGKPAKVVATMLAIIVTGSIFYGTGGYARSPEDLLRLFNGFGGLVFMLIFAGLLLGGGIWLFREEKKKENFRLARFYLFLGLYISSSLLIPIFSPTGYVGERSDSFAVLYDLISVTNGIALLMLLWYTFSLIFGLFGGGNAISNAWQSSEFLRDSFAKDADFKRTLGLLREDVKKGTEIVKRLKGLIGVRAK